MKKLSVILSLFAVMAFNFSENKKIKIWLIGDSTMSVKEKKAYPETGWGMPFVNFWDSTVTIDNRAVNGRSTRTFMEEKRWEPVVSNMQEGDYVFIQFGHNDEVPTKLSYVPEADFKANLIKYINDTRSKKANPVLLTPVARRKFDSTGHIQETHAVYAQIVRDVAKENNVPLIDLAEKAKALYQQLGPGASKYLFNYLVPGEHPNYPDGKQDDTHFSELGARKIAELVLAEIQNLKLGLVGRIINKTSK
ncbi:MAG: rhamnogalacturonan acetylesterase [Chitinophagaceae bacterium]